MSQRTTSYSDRRSSITYKDMSVKNAVVLQQVFTSKCQFQNGGIRMTVYGYARVSTDGQTLDAQQDQLKQAGVEKVFSEKVSGAKTDRQELKRVIKLLKQDDVLLVTKLDRLARSLRDILNVLNVMS